MTPAPSSAPAFLDAPGAPVADGRPEGALDSPKAPNATSGRPFADPPGRLLSLDAYRGFVILVMIWVNFLAGMAGTPAWLQHAAADADTFTLPDLVFPGFLLMVGMAIPLAFRGAIEGGVPRLPLAGRIAWRAGILLCAGVVWENAWRYDPSAALLPKTLFLTLWYLALAAAWWQSPRKRPWHTGAAVGAIVVLMLLFRGKVGDGFTWPYLEHTWWGILGLIGWAYAACALVYLACRGSGTALMGSFAFMLALYMGERSGRLDFLPGFVKSFVGVGSVFGSTAANVMAGVLAGRLFLPGAFAGAGPREAHLRRAGLVLLYAAGFLAAGLLLRPYHGISKINATESFTLVTAAVNLLGFLAFYALIDVFRWRAWAAFLVPAGTNALLAYILPDFWNQLTALVGLGRLWWGYAWPYLSQGGTAGMLNAAAVSLFMLGLTVLATRAGIRLKA